MTMANDNKHIEEQNRTRQTVVANEGLCAYGTEKSKVESIYNSKNTKVNVNQSEGRPTRETSWPPTVELSTVVTVGCNPDVNINDGSKVGSNNVGVENYGVVVGCNANNSNASARTVNSNNAVSNSNDNYAGRFALNYEEESYGKHYTTCSAGTKITEEMAHNSFDEVMGLLQGEYSSEDEVFGSSESIADSPVRESDIWQELRAANAKRKLKNLKRFLTNREIVTTGVERCIKRASNSPEKTYAKNHKEEIISKIIEEFENETYHVQPCIQRKLPKRGKDGKERNANIFCIYDRCVQNVIYLVIKDKLINKVLRQVYSGIKGRSVFSNDKTYCMKDKIHTFCVNHPDAYVMTTDITKFYENTDSKIVLGILFEVIQDRYMRLLLADILLSLPSLPIGGTLSQLFATLLMDECDRYIINHFKPKIYCIFGDNRLYGDEDKQKLIKIREYQAIYYESRYNLKMKNDYCLSKVRNGFRFCKTFYNDRYVKIRGELRRRCIRAAIKGQKNYAAYKGFLMKTDSKRLQRLIENELPTLRKRIKYDKNIDFEQWANKIIKINKDVNLDTKVNGKLIGEKFNISYLVDKNIVILDYIKEKSTKSDSDFYYSFLCAVPVKLADGTKKTQMVKSWNSSIDIRYFFQRVENGELKLPIHTKVKKVETSFYFEGYRDFTKDATEKILEDFGITFDEDEFNDETIVKSSK